MTPDDDAAPRAPRTPPDLAARPAVAHPAADPAAAAAPAKTPRFAGNSFGPFKGENLGLFLMVAAVFLFTIMDVIAKDLTSRHDPVMVAWARYASQFGWALVLLAPWLRTLAKTPYLKLQLLRSTLMFGATLSFFIALSYMPIADAVAVFEVAPLIITALAFFILKEKVGPRRWTGVAIGFVGALIIIRPGSDVFTVASLLPMVAAFCFACFSIVTRFLGDKENPWTSFLYSAVVGTVAASLALPFVWSTPTKFDAGVMALFGLLGGAGQFLLILALRHASASAIAPFSYMGLVFATLWGWLVFSEFPDAWTISGAALIVSAGLYVWWRERVRATRA